MFGKQNSQQVEKTSFSNHVTSGGEFPKHLDAKMGDIFIDTDNLRTAFAISYPKIGCRWIDTVEGKILARDTSFTENLAENFQYKNDKHARLFWEAVDRESLSIDLKNHELNFHFGDAKSGNNKKVLNISQT
ncbi:MAG: hypothetical protein QXE84_02055 [Candidatus Nitrosotenuis sp.]|uniref:Uncharacterized protein n=1 Tax=Candidatus Nitrosotenuis uzonensis TaxID=1407055 RepID=A0A812EYV6_9ARCH|nr:hypothetical protein [Candidatus Nitrosotenuis uzonensis]CAE6500805.1 hypothetical protein NUZ5A_51066 [Candidatus Nitrosotenuis uzonensis]